MSSDADDVFIVSGQTVSIYEKYELKTTFLRFSANNEAQLDKVELNATTDVDDIVLRLLRCRGAWSVIYYRPDLNYLFIGRDIFGRYSCVWSHSQDSLALSTMVNLDVNKVWNELPYGQVTAISLLSNSNEFYTFFESYPENNEQLWLDSLPGIERATVTINDALIKVAGRVAEPSEKVNLSKELLSRLTDATTGLLESGESVVCVAFSGGVDSLLVAHAVHMALPSTSSIDLVNVSFGNTEEICATAPDRKRCQEAYAHLKASYPQRSFRLIFVNVPETTLNLQRQKYIARAAAPATSVLDDSLACVVWFAIRAEGKDAENGMDVSSTANSVFVGSGADELFAGYARHRHRHERDTAEGRDVIEGVREECEHELRRLGLRNGGRDARMAAQLGKKLKAPFLEDEFVAWANSIPVSSKCDLTLPRGQGEKLIIRQALQSLGAPHTAPKQAMQFGSRIAKMTNAGSKDIKGSDTSQHLTKNISASDHGDE